MRKVIAMLRKKWNKCSSLQIANRRTCHHIVWPLLNLCNISEGTQLLAQVDIATCDCNLHIVTYNCQLAQVGSVIPDKIPDSLTRILSDRTYNDKLINHPPFQRDQMWYLGRKASGSLCLCSGCLHPRCIQNNDLQLYVQGLLLLKERRVVDTKLRFCLPARCVNGISSLYNNRPL